jgi:hypothetical protein
MRSPETAGFAVNALDCFLPWSASPSVAAIKAKAVSQQIQTLRTLTAVKVVWDSSLNSEAESRKLIRSC